MTEGHSWFIYYQVNILHHLNVNVSIDIPSSLRHHDISYMYVQVYMGIS